MGRQHFYRDFYTETRGGARPVKEQPTHCPMAARLAAWAGRSVQPLIDNATPAALNQAKIKLFDKYWEARSFLSSAHRHTDHQDEGLLCVDDVWEDYSQRIRVSWFDHVSPDYHLPPPRRPRIAKPSQQIFGLEPAPEIIEADAPPPTE